MGHQSVDSSRRQCRLPNFHVGGFDDIAVIPRTTFQSILADRPNQCVIPAASKNRIVACSAVQRESHTRQPGINHILTTTSENFTNADALESGINHDLVVQLGELQTLHFVEIPQRTR